MELTLEERLQLVLDHDLEWLRTHIGEQAKLTLDRRAQLAKAFARMVVVELEQQAALSAERADKAVS